MDKTVVTIETEKKYRLPVERLDAVLAELRRSDARADGEVFEENTIYAGSSLPEGSIIRLRRIGDRAILTFKRRVENIADVKQQIEYETDVTDAQAVSKILHELDLRPRLIYEKRRRIWQMPRAEIVIDELPFGLFMEIEGSITTIREAEILLSIDDLETEHETYPMLTSRLGKNSAGIMEARFS